MTVPHAWTAPEQSRLAMTSKIEMDVAGAKGRLNTAFVGGIPEGVTDETMERMLAACGSIIKWKRVCDANNVPKNFGFCEFGSADAINRALDILHELPMGGSAATIGSASASSASGGGRRLMVKVDEITKEYLLRYAEALGADQVAMSSKEADLQAMTEIKALMKERGIFAAFEAIEKKITILTAEAPEEGEAFDDEPTEADEQAKRSELSERGHRGFTDKQRNHSRSRDRREVREPREQQRDSERESRAIAEAKRAFKERERKWEAREAQMAHRRKRDLQAEEATTKRATEEREYAAKYLSSLDDTNWLVASLDRLLGIHRTQNDPSPGEGGRVPDFYTNRELWKTRRMREREREEDWDRRDEEREREEVRERQARELAARHQREEEEGAAGKRARPKASEFLETEASSTGGSNAKRRKPLISGKDYTREELLAAGMSEEEAFTKLRELYKEKVNKLIALIPQSLDDLFNWDVEWKHLNMDKMYTWIRKKVADILAKLDKSERYLDRTTRSLVKQIEQHSDPRTIVTWVYEDGLLSDERAPSERRREEASTFVAILWRYLVFETETVAYDLHPPQ